MKRLLLLAIIGSAIVAPSAQAPVQAGLDAAIASIDATIAADFAKDGVGGLSMGVVSGKELIWSKHYGYADAEAKRVADNDTTYRVGSITKQFTALALLQLVEKNQMRLTDPLEKYIPEVKQVKSPPAGTPPITILQVATMTSGLAREPDCDNHSVGSDAEWQKIVLRCLPQTSYVNEPGTTYLYSNIGYATLGLAVERAGRQPFIDLVRDRILVPLGMSRSAMEASTTVRANLAHGYQRSEAGGTPSRAAADRALDGRGYRVPNGGLLSTVNDLAKFVAWKVGDGPSGILKKEAQEANYSRAFFYGPGMYTGYGVGFQIQWRGPVLMLGHGGSTDGYHSSLLVHRPTHLGVIVLRNCDNCPVDAAPVAARALAQLVTAKAKQSQGSLPPPEPQKEEDSLVRRLAGGARADLGAPLATVARSGADAHQPRRPNQSLAGVRVVKTYTAERREDLVFTKGALRLFRNIAKSMLEIWYWMDLNRPTHTREIKRLEIQVAKLVDRIGRP